MTASPPRDARSPRDQRETIRRHERRHAGWRDRIDPIFLLLTLLTTVVLGAGLLMAVELGRNLLLRADQPVARLKDARLLDNVYRPGAVDRFVGAAYHAGGDQILVASGDGAMHAYRRDTGLWRNLPAAREEAVTTAARESAVTTVPHLRDGCGGDPDCPDRDGVWARYQDGYLARFDENGWRTLTNASRYLNRDQQPVQAADLTAAAYAPDGLWLALVDNKGSLGLYEPEKRRWHQVPIDVQTQLAWAPIQKMQWWGASLWIATSQGLLRLQNPGSRDTTITQVDDIAGKVTTLSVDQQDRLLVLSRGACPGGGDCVRIHRFDQADAPATMLLDTHQQPSDFSLNRLRQVYQSGDNLFLVGDMGLLQYDLRRHRWQELEKSRINHSLMHHNGTTLYFAGNGVLGYADAFHAQQWTAPGHIFYQVSQRPDGAVFAISDKGAVFQIFDDQPPLEVFSGERSHLDPSSFFTAVAIEDYLLLVGKDGALLHHLRKRTYQDLPRSTRTAWLLDPTTQLFSSSGHLYALSTTGGEVFARTMPLQMVIDGNLRVPQSLSSVPAPVRRVRDWPEQGLGLIGGDGAAYLLTPTQTFAMSSPQPLPPSLRNGQTLDVLSDKQSLLVSTDAGFHEYLYDRRAWRILGEVPTKTQAVDLARFDDQIVYRTDTHRLARINRFRPYLIGGPRLIDMTDDQLEDVRLDEQVLYLAGNQRVVAYDLQQRQVRATWRQDGAFEQRIQALVGGEPLVLARGKAFLGERALFNELAGKTEQLSFDGTLIWALHRRDGVPELKGLHPNLGTTRCFYRFPYPRDGADRFDAVVELPNGHLAVLTNRGLQFYNPFAKSWYRGKEPIMRQGGRLALVGDHLLMLEERNGRGTMWHIPVRSIRAADPCNDEPYSFQTFRYDGRAFTIDPTHEQAAWLDARGNLIRWQRGALTASSLDQSESTDQRGPPQSQLRAVFTAQRRQSLIFTTPNHIYRYHLPQRRWHRVTPTFEVAARAPYQTNFQFADMAEVWRVSLKDSAGRLYLAEWDGNDPNIHFELFVPAPTMTPQTAPGPVIAAQGRTDTPWFFFDQRHMTLFEPNGGARYGPMPHQLSQPRVLQWGEQWLVQDEADQKLYLLSGRAEQTRLIAFPGSTLPAIDALGRLWTITGDGRVVRLENENGRLREKENFGGEALSLPVDKVRSAWEWDDLLLVVAGTDSVVIDQVTRKQYPVQDGALLNRLRSVQREGPRLWASTEDGLLEFNFGNVERGLEQRRLQGEAVHRDSEGRLWLYGPQGWQRHNAGQSTVSGDSLYVYHRGGVFTWSRDGRVTNLAGTRQARLPFREQPRALIADRNNRWWVITATDARLLAPGDQGDLVEQARLPLPDDVRPSASYDIRAYQELSGSRLVLNLADGRELDLRPFADANRQVQIRGAVNSGPGRDGMRDQWPTHQKNMKAGSEGRVLFDPYTHFEQDGTGYLFAVRTSGERLPLEERGTVKPLPLPNLDVDWLRFDGERDALLAATPSGERAVSAAQLLHAQRGLFTAPKAVVFDQNNALIAAFPAGTLRFPNGRLDFGQPNCLFTPHRFQGAVHAYREALVDDRGAFAATNLNGAALANPLRFQFGPLTIEEDYQQQRLRFVSSALGKDGDLYRNGTFLWDQTPDQLVFDDKGQLMSVGRLGLLEIDQLAHFIPLPEPDTEAQTAWRSGGPLTLRHGSRTYHYRKGSWQQGPAPTSQTPPTAWQEWLSLHPTDTTRSSQGDIQHHLQREALPEAPLLGAVATRNSLFVLTNRRLIQHRFLPNTPPPLQHDLPFEPLPSLQITAEGRARISDGTGFFEWDPVTNRLEQRDPATLAEAHLVDWRGLRFTRRKNRIVKEMQLSDEQGRRRWVTYDFVQQRFPFDVVTAVTTQAGNLLVGTALGLQRYPSGSSFGWESVASVWSPAAAGNQEDHRVTRLGVDIAMPNGCRVDFGTQALVLVGNEKPRPIQSGDYAARRADHPLWRWSRMGDGRLEARYRFANGGFSAPISFRDRQAPHDQLEDIACFNNRVYVLWRNGWVSQHLNQLAIDLAVVTYDTRSFQPSDLVVFPKARTVAGVTLAAGVYLRNGDGGIMRLEESGPRQLDGPAVKAAMDQRDDDGALMRFERLRLVRAKGQRRLQFELVGEADQRQVLTWSQDGRLGIDRLRRLFFAGPHPLALTDAGIVSLAFGADQSIQIDPAALEIVRLTSDGSDLTTTDDGGWRDGRLVVRLNERSDALYQMDPPFQANRIGTFRRIEGADPFANQVMVRGTEPPWTWYLRNRKEGGTGDWVIENANFDIVLGARGFQFDDIIHLQSRPQGGYDLITRGNGWFTLTGDNFHLANWRRPAVNAFDPAQVIAATTTFQENNACLAVTLQDGRKLYRDPNGRWQELTALSELQAVDATRVYERHHDGALSMRLLADETVITEHLRDGRFSEDIALGFPLAEADGTRLLPTAAGVLSVLPDFEYGAVQTGPFPGLPPNTAPRVLLRHDGHVVYLGEDGLHTLAAPHEVLLPLASIATAPIEEIVALTTLGDDLLHFQREREGVVSDHWFHRGNGGLLPPQSTPIRFRHLPWFRERPHLWAQSPDAAIVLTDQGPAWLDQADQPIGPASGGKLRAVFTVGDDLYMVTPRDILKLDLPLLWRQRAAAP